METILNHLIQATGWSILHSLWQAALIYALLLPFQTKALKISAKARYGLAYAANCLTFLCFVFTFFSIFSWPSAEVPAQDLATTALVLPLSLPQVIIHYVEMVFPYLVLLYAAGLIIQSYIVIKGYQKVQTLKHSSYTAIPEAWQLLFDQLKAGLGLRKAIDFRLSDHVNVPLVIGFFKPVILFPVALAAQMETAQLEAILIHELSHIRRNDYVFNLIRTMIDTVLFFNPFVKLTGKFIDIEREHACDDLVVKITAKPLTYAHALLNLEILADKRTPVFALAATGNNQHLYQRIKRITDMKTNYSNPKQKLFAITLTIATIVSLAWINPAKSERQQNAEKALQSQTASQVTAVHVQDTTKKKAAQRLNAVRMVSPKNPRAPKVPLSPKAPKQVPGGEMPEMPEVPEAPEAPVMPEIPEINLNYNEMITPAVGKAMANLSVNVNDMVLTNVNANTPAERRKMQAQMQKLSAEIQRNGALLQKKFDSPEQRAKFQKYAAEMKAKYDTPEQRAKWQKYAAEMEAKFNSPEQRAKYEKMAKDAQELAQRSVNSPEFKIKIRDLEASNQLSNVMIMGNDDKQKIRQTPEYIELKKKFDKDVEELAKKKEKSENK